MVPTGTNFRIECTIHDVLQRRGEWYHEETPWAKSTSSHRRRVAADHYKATPHFPRVCFSLSLWDKPVFCLEDFHNFGFLCLYYTFKEVNIWPSQANVRRFMPSSLRAKNPSTRVIIYATETFIDHHKESRCPVNNVVHVQKSQYVQVLLGITPNSKPLFASELYDGGILDKEIVKRSGLVQLLEAGDSVMADRGFLIKDLLPKGVTLNIPALLGR